jgi:hypothetical protein
MSAWSPAPRVEDPLHACGVVLSTPASPSPARRRRLYARRGATRSAKRRMDLSTRSLGIRPPGFIHVERVEKPISSRSASSRSATASGVPKTAYSPSTFVVGDLGQTVGAHLARLGRLRGRAVVNIEALVVAGQAASPDAELQAPFGKYGRRSRHPRPAGAGDSAAGTWTAIPILTRCVHAARAEATMRGAAGTDRSFWKWISASHTASKPKSSAAFICASGTP